MTVYYTTSTISQYFENEDEIFITMKEYNEDILKDKYPTFTVCFKGTEFYWNNDLKIFNAYSLNATQFELMLKGERAMKYEGIQEGNAYKYKKVPIYIGNGSYQNFDSFHLQVPDFYTLYVL